MPQRVDVERAEAKLLVASPPKEVVLLVASPSGGHPQKR